MKRTFKDFFNQDVERVYFNPDELAETVLINGKPMDVVVDDNELERRKLIHGEKLTKAELLFHVSKSVFGNVPKPDVLLDFNKKRYRILDVNNTANRILTITLERFSS